MPDFDAQHFSRQRRNLILISLFYIFYLLAGIEFNQIYFLGNQADIKRPELVSYALALFFVYYFWRYFTACNEISGIAKLKASIHSRIVVYLGYRYAQNHYIKVGLPEEYASQLVYFGDNFKYPKYTWYFKEPIINDRRLEGIKPITIRGWLLFWFQIKSSGLA